jgi:hypothetical protein
MLTMSNALRRPLDVQEAKSTNPHATARSLAIEIRHTVQHRPVTHEELDAIGEAAGMIVELLTEKRASQ